MTWTRFVLMLAISALVTIPIIWLVPHARKSFFFDWLLRLATFAIGFLSAWLALGFAAAGAPASLTTFVIADVAVVPALLGALLGALTLNLSLWIVDLFSSQGIEEDEAD